jgi:acetyltransferase-like isoleucine patch superfamily enzyme
MIEKKYPDLWERVHKLGRTSSILHPVNDSLTFARTSEYLKKLYDVSEDIIVIVPYEMEWKSVKLLPTNVTVFRLYEEDNIQYVFTCLHNSINKYKYPMKNMISPTANIHESAIVGVHGNTYCSAPDKSKINLKHMGNVVIEDDVDVEALCIVHRSTMASTVIKKGAKVCVKVNVGHNCYVGERTILAPGVMLGGETKIGKDCYIWQGVITRSKINICDNVIIGAGSLVMHDIEKSGIYFGSPAKYVKPYDPTAR